MNVIDLIRRQANEMAVWLNKRLRFIANWFQVEFAKYPYITVIFLLISYLAISRFIFIWLDWEGLTFISITLAVIVFTLNLLSRREEREIRMWNLATDPRAGNSGKVPALEYLNRHKKSLQGIVIPESYLVNVQLPNANLEKAKLGGRIYGEPISKARYYGMPILKARNYGEPILKARNYGELILKARNYGMPIS